MKINYIQKETIEAAHFTFMTDNFHQPYVHNTVIRDALYNASDKMKNISIHVLVYASNFVVVKRIC